MQRHRYLCADRVSHGIAPGDSIFELKIAVVLRLTAKNGGGARVEQLIVTSRARGTKDRCTPCWLRVEESDSVNTCFVSNKHMHTTASIFSAVSLWTQLNW